MKKRPSVGLFVWSSGDNFWGGWQGFVGLYKNKTRALDRLYTEKNRQNNKAQLVDYNSLKVIASYEKKENKWSEVRNG